jgi:hypothetical protein
VGTPGPLGSPEAVTLVQLIAKATGETVEGLMSRKNRRAIPHRMERCGYVPVRNPLAADGLWKVQKASGHLRAGRAPRGSADRCGQKAGRSA